MWVSQIRLSDEVISGVRALAAKRRLSVNRTIEDLVRDQLAFLARCESGQFKHAKPVGPKEVTAYHDGPVLDRSYAQD